MILDFNEIKKEDVLVAGGKGANLGEMTSAKINVPSGFVITADAYRDFLKVNGIDILIENGIKKSVEDERKLLNEAEHFRGKIKSGKFPERLENAIREKYFNLGNNTRVAVRSSATAEDLPDASFAGQQETYLNVQGIESVLNAVRNCYASLWGNRAVSYRFHQGYDQTSVSIAVVIQEMIESEKSGVLFTVNPVNKKENEMQINASFGLGESVVSGRVTADSYIIDKSGKIAQVNIGSKETQIIYGDNNFIVKHINKIEKMILKMKKKKKIRRKYNMAFFTQAIEVLKVLVTAIGAGLGAWGVINLLEGYGSDNPGAKSQGIKQFMAK